MNTISRIMEQAGGLRRPKYVSIQKGHSFAGRNG